MLKGILTAVLAIGVLKPDLLIKYTDFWRMYKQEPNNITLVATRIVSLILILLVWMRL